MTRSRNKQTQPRVAPIVAPSAHVQVIEVLMDNEYDSHTIVRLLAQEHPELFIELHRRTKVGEQPWVKEVFHAALSGNHVSGIKTLRAAQNWGLKEAKDTYDTFRTGLATNGVIPTAPETTAFLSDAQRAVAEQLLASARNVQRPKS